MPNYKLPPKLRQHMVSRAEFLAKRRIALAESDFPLTKEDIQPAFIDERVRVTLLQLIAEGVTSIKQSGYLYAGLPASVVGDRPVALQFKAGNSYSDGLYYMREEQTSDGRVRMSMERDEPWACFDLSVISAEKRDEFIKWVRNAVRERRLAEVTTHTVRWFLEHGVKGVEHITAAHIMARWPTLATLIDGYKPTWYDAKNAEAVKYAKAKFREVPANLDRWGWSLHDKTHGDYAKRARAMKLADMFLQSAQMVPEITDDPAAVQVNVIWYKKLPGEMF